jgi:hypothetical protein
MTEGACEVAGTTDQRSTAKHKSVANAAFTTVLKVSIGSARLPVSSVVRRGAILFYPPGGDRTTL